jgi:putative DNA primase/helicase
VVRLAIETARSIYGEAAAEPDQHKRNALAKHARETEKEPRIRAMLSLAKHHKPIVSQQENFDMCRDLFNCQNGTIDLRTGELEAHEPTDFITKVAPLNYDPYAECPLWMKFLKRITGEDAELMDYLQRAVGYTLTGDTSEQVLFMCYGSGANGKSVFLETIHGLLGNYAQKAEFSSFLAQDRPSTIRNDIASMAGARLVSASEVDEGRHLNEALIKSLTGGDTIRARRLYHEHFDYLPQFKLWFAVNYKPGIRELNNAIWRRIHLILFNQAIPENEQDHQLKVKLRAEFPGIFAWAIRGCLDWRKCGLLPPPSVLSATVQYRQDSDNLAKFIDDCCVRAEDTWVGSGALYAAFKQWCEANGEHPISLQKLSSALSDWGKGEIILHRSGSRGRHWKGIGLLSKEPTE